MSRYEFAAGDEITAAKLNKNIIGGSYNAGETINGATLPVPVYQADDTYKLDSISQESGNNHYAIYGTKYTCQTFKVDTPNYSNLKLDKISLYLEKYNNPSGNFTVEIYAVDGDNKPTGSVLASANMAANSIVYGYNDFEFDYEFDYDTTYAIVAKCTDGNSSSHVMWYYQNSNMYTNGQMEISSDGGSTWSIYSSYDFRFKVYYNYKFGDVGEFYKSDANDISRLNFVGFAISNGTDGNPIDIQFNGIVKGFSGLDEGEKYYVQDTAGTIGTSKGTYNILVGVAISTTELLILKDERKTMGIVSRATGESTTVTINHNLGKIPQLFKLTTIYHDSSIGNYAPIKSEGYYDGNSQGCLYYYKSGNPNYGQQYSTTKIGIIDDSSISANDIIIVASNLTETQVTLTFTVTYDRNTIMMWEAI